MTTLLVVLLAVAGYVIWSTNKKLEQLKEDYDQATFAAWRVLMLADNGEELYIQLKRWTNEGFIQKMTGEKINEGNLQVMRVNKAILDNSEGKPWLEASEEYRSTLKQMGL
tara:strand:- start:56 stop:388 length:333 start_codon:yes stop_codon:yes gene_type:complete